MMENLDFYKMDNRFSARALNVKHIIGCSSAEPPKPTLGDLIKKERTNQGIGVTELARKLKCSRTTIYRIENNEVIPKFKTVMKLAEALRADKRLFIKKLEEITRVGL